MVASWIGYSYTQRRQNSSRQCSYHHNSETRTVTTVRPAHTVATNGCGVRCCPCYRLAGPSESARSVRNKNHEQELFLQLVL
jgi:hypothetical protein